MAPPPPNMAISSNIYIYINVLYTFVIYIHLPNDKPRAIIYELINLPAMNQLVTRPLGFSSRNAAFKWYNQVGYKVNWWRIYRWVTRMPSWGVMNPFIYREGPSCKIAVPAFAAFSIAPGEYSLKLLEHINWRMHVQLISGFQKKNCKSSNMCRFNKDWLVVYLPLWKIWVRQLGWWNSQSMESHNPFMFQIHQSVPVQQGYPLVNVYITMENHFF